MQHDVDYSVCANKPSKDQVKCKNEADKKMVKALDAIPWKDRQWGHAIARNTIATKAKVVYSLKCYSCLEFGKPSEENTVCSKSKMETNEAKYVKTCALDTCIRRHGTGLDIHSVTASCTSKDLCEAAKKACEESGEDCGVACCTTDRCNAGSYLSYSVFLMTVCSVLGLYAVNSVTS
ncbi:hypothetical protein ACROYT_G007761 [Oculina patagonica]